MLMFAIWIEKKTIVKDRKIMKIVILHVIRSISRSIFDENPLKSSQSLPIQMEINENIQFCFVKLPFPIFT
jgi:hypothetical protein